MGSGRSFTINTSDPKPGSYQLISAGFNVEKKPYILLQKDGIFTSLEPLVKTLTLDFDTSQRYCIGYSDISTGERFTCTEQKIVESKYDQCAVCQNKTGFNPAFYHATSVSPQQEARNAEPHILYLAHFAPGVIKVGISHAKRNLSRLLEQGARTAIILDTFPTAHIARQYEASIAQMPDIQETIQLRKKVALLTKEYDKEAAFIELANTKRSIEQLLNISFNASEPLFFDDYYFPNGQPLHLATYDCTNGALISGEAIGVQGTILCCVQQETLLHLPVKQFSGYLLRLSYDETAVDLPASQLSLF